LISSIFNNQERGEDKPRVDQIYIAEDRILDFVQDELAKKYFNSGVNLNKNEY
jgi:hypothetical protein